MVRWGRKAGRRQVHTEGVRKFLVRVHLQQWWREGGGGSGGKKEGVEWRRECWRQESMTNVAGGGFPAAG